MKTNVSIFLKIKIIYCFMDSVDRNDILNIQHRACQFIKHLKYHVEV